jgi:adenine phosphoribosyltransferase
MTRFLLFQGGFDARGFVLGPPIALALNKPFFMLRKPGKDGLP